MTKRISMLFLWIITSVSLCGCTSVGEKTASLSVIYLVAAVISVFLLLGYLLGTKKKDFWFIVLFASIAVVNIGYYSLSVSGDLSSALWANRVSYLGSVFLPLSMLMIILDTTKCKYKKALPICLAVLGAVVFAIAASPGISDIYYKEVTLNNINGVAVLEKVYGDWHIIYLFYLLGYFAATVSAAVYATVKKRTDSVGGAVMLNIAVFVNLGVWLIEQFVKIDFEFLSISYIISELFLLGLNFLMQEAKKEPPLSEPDIQPEITDKNAVTAEQKNAFLNGIKTLTKTEKHIFDLYIDGKSTKEILELLNIKENTLKYHNKNIYGKLGVSTRRQLIEISNQINT